MDNFSKKIRLLILSCGTNACYHMTKTIKKKFNNDFFIIGADINEEYMIPNIHFIDKFYQVPFSHEEGYYEKILSICKKENVDFIIPSLDVDQQLFYPTNKDLIKINCKSLSTHEKLLAYYSDKNKLFSLLEKNNFPVPKHFNISEIKDNELYFIKPIDGFGSIGAKKIMGKEIKNIEKIDKYVIQEVCLNPEYTTECFYYNKNISSVTRERIRATAGVCVKTKLFRNPKLEEIAFSVAKKLDFPPIFNIQFMKNNNDEFVIIDINLRLAGGMSLSYAGGWDEVSAFANILLGKTNKEIFSNFNLSAPVQYIVRAYEDIVTKTEKEVIAFDLDGTLLNSFKRHEIVLKNSISKHGLGDIDLSKLIEVKRNGNNNISYMLEKGIDLEKAKNIQKDWIENIEKYEYLKNDFLYPNTIELLEKHSKENDLILITARSNKETAQKQIKNLNIEKFFRHVFIIENSNNSAIEKAKILSKLNAVKMIGDTEVDAQAAKIANIKFEPVFYGFRNKEYLIKEMKK